MSLNKIKIPKIIYGTAWKKEKTTDLVVTAIKSGFRGIDTACQPKHYNEKLVGEALIKLDQEGIKRKDIFLQTKFTSVDGQDINNVPYDINANLEAQVEQSFNKSKENLNTNYIDSLVLHSPMRTFEQTMKVWHKLEEIKKGGEIGILGISNCYNLNLLKEIYEKANVKPSVIQNRFYRDTNFDNDLRKWCSEKGIIYQSFWTLTANPNILNNKSILEISKKIDQTPVQIFFNYLNSKGIVPLTGTTSKIHMEEDLKSFSFNLTKEECSTLESLIE